MLAACTCEDVRVTRIMARLLAWIDIAFILIEIVSIVALLAFGKGSASIAVMRLFEGDLSTTFWAGFVTCGLAIPLVAEAVSLARKRERWSEGFAFESPSSHAAWHLRHSGERHGMQGKGTRCRSAQGRARSRVDAGERNTASRPFGRWQLRKEALKAGERDRLAHAGNGHMR